MIQIPHSLSSKMSNMGFVCAILVVLIHIPSPRWIKGWLNEGICTVAVPYFFMMSGFLLERGRGEYFDNVVRRLKTLVMPFFCWNIIGVLYLSSLLILANIHAGRPWNLSLQIYNCSYWIGALGLNPFEEPAHNFLWYVRALFIFVLCSPVLRYLIQKVGWWLVIFVWGISFAFAMGGLGLSREWNLCFQRTIPLIGGTYFLCGMLLAQRDQFPFIPGIIKVGGLLLGIVLLIIMAIRANNGLALSLAWRVVLIPCLIGWIWKIMPSEKVRWTNLSFPLYIVHWFFAVLFWWYIPGILRQSALMYPVRLIIVFTGSLGVIFGLRFFLPRVASVMFGGRF